MSFLGLTEWEKPLQINVYIVVTANCESAASANFATCSGLAEIFALCSLSH
jgi:hypothetical protein